MTKARRVRKVFGGSMRQAGFMAGAGIYALQNNIERLSQDHLHAKLIGEALMKKDFAKNIMPVETNIVIVTTKENCPAKQIAERLYQKGVQVIDIGPNELRFVTHLDISEVMVEKTIQIIKEL